jgi:hypothetical protein
MADGRSANFKPFVSPYLRQPVRELKKVQKEQDTPDSELKPVPPVVTASLPPNC